MRWGCLGKSTDATEGLAWVEVTFGWVITFKSEQLPWKSQENRLSSWVTLLLSELETPVEKLCLEPFCIILACPGFPTSVKQINSFLVSSVFGAV